MIIARPPAELSELVLAFCRRVSADDRRPFYVPVRPIAPSSAADPVEATRRTAASRGDVLYGWTIWICPGVFIEAEQHAIIQTEAGAIDVATHIGDVTRVLFQPAILPRPDASWSETVREPLSDDADILQWLQCTRTRAELIKRHARGQSLYVTGSVLRDLRQLDQQCSKLDEIVSRRLNLP